MGCGLLRMVTLGSVLLEELVVMTELQRGFWPERHQLRAREGPVQSAPEPRGRAGELWARGTVRKALHQPALRI